MKFRKRLILSMMVLTFFIVTACSNGDTKVVPEENPINSDVNVDEPVNGDVDPGETFEDGFGTNEESNFGEFETGDAFGDDLDEEGDNAINNPAGNETVTDEDTADQ